MDEFQDSLARADQSKGADNVQAFQTVFAFEDPGILLLEIGYPVGYYLDKFTRGFIEISQTDARNAWSWANRFIGRNS